MKKAKETESRARDYDIPPDVAPDWRELDPQETEAHARRATRWSQ